MTFRDVEAIGLALADVESTTTWGKAALQVHGKVFACLSAHKSVEPDTLVLRMEVDQRDSDRSLPGSSLRTGAAVSGRRRCPAETCDRRVPVGSRGVAQAKEGGTKSRAG